MKIATEKTVPGRNDPMLRFAASVLNRELAQPVYHKRFCRLKGMQVEIVRLYDRRTPSKPALVFARYRFTTLRKGMGHWRYVEALPRARFVFMTLKLELAKMMKQRQRSGDFMRDNVLMKSGRR